MMIDVNPQLALGDAIGVKFESLKASIVWTNDEYRLVYLSGRLTDDPKPKSMLVIERQHGYDVMGQERWIALNQLDQSQATLLLSILTENLKPLLESVAEK